MNAYEEADKLYRSQGRNFSQVLIDYIRFGYLFIQPDRLLIGRPIIGERINDWLTREQFGEADTWFVHLAIGRNNLPWFLGSMPFYLPNLCWQRDFKAGARLHRIKTDSLAAKLSNQNSHGINYRPSPATA